MDLKNVFFFAQKPVSIASSGNFNKNVTRFLRIIIKIDNTSNSPRRVKTVIKD